MEMGAFGMQFSNRGVLNSWSGSINFFKGYAEKIL